MTDNQPIIQLDEGWENIKNRALDPLKELLDKDFQNQTKLFSDKEYAEIYTVCYNMCTQRSPYNWSEDLYNRHGETIADYLTSRVVPSLSELKGDQLLKELVRRSDNHKVMNKWMKNFFTYLDRYYVKYHHLPLLQQSGNSKFKILVLDVVKREVDEAILTLSDNERDGATIHRELIRKANELFEDMESIDTYDGPLVTGMGVAETYTDSITDEITKSLATNNFFPSPVQTALKPIVTNQLSIDTELRTRTPTKPVYGESFFKRAHTYVNRFQRKFKMDDAFFDNILQAPCNNNQAEGMAIDDINKEIEISKKYL